jgi:hypothetical protein
MGKDFSRFYWSAARRIMTALVPFIKISIENIREKSRKRKLKK